MHPDAKCLCIIAAAEGTTACIIDQGTMQKLANNQRVRDWSIQRFDASTALRTDCSKDTEMILYFVPVLEDISPQQGPQMNMKPKLKSKSKEIEVNDVQPRYPLRLIRELPIQACICTAVFFDQTRMPDKSDARRATARLGCILQTAQGDEKRTRRGEPIANSRARLRPRFYAACRGE